MRENLRLELCLTCSALRVYLFMFITFQLKKHVSDLDLHTYML